MKFPDPIIPNTPELALEVLLLISIDLSIFIFSSYNSIEAIESDDVILS